MDLVSGFLYNVRGLSMGIKTGKLLFWGLIRFTVIVIMTLIFATLVLMFHQDILNLIWGRPESQWILWLWYLLSWILSLLLIGIAVILSFIISQILFSVMVMDHMSRITEFMITGMVKEGKKISSFKLFSHLLKQEIPRTILPVVLSILLMVLGLLVPFGSILMILSSGIAIIFLAWDNTDLIPARRLVPFRTRFRFLLKTIPFHIGFGLPFLVPGLNILFLSFAPVGATLYYLERQDRTGVQIIPDKAGN